MRTEDRFFDAQDHLVPTAAEAVRLERLTYDGAGALVERAWYYARPAPLQAGEWDESKHPRIPSGSSAGGEFASEEGPAPSAGVEYHETPRRRDLSSCPR